MYLIDKLPLEDNQMLYKWSRRVKTGEPYYEVSTKGDRRYSALVAKLNDGRTIEEAYQLDVKGYRQQGNNWKLGKGRPPLTVMSDEELYSRYKSLWITFFNENIDLLSEISIQAQNTTLTDMFAKSDVNQARAICDILNNNGDKNMGLEQTQVMNLPKLSLYRDNKANRVSSLNWAVRGDYPRIVIYINGPDRSVTGRDNMITAPFTFLGINAFLTALKELTLSTTPPGTTYETQCYNTKFVDGKRTDETTVQATVTTGKDDNGIIYILVKADDKPNMRFDLNIPQKWFKMQRNGVEVSGTQKGSELFTTGYIKQIEESFNDMLKKTKELYTPEKNMF